MTIDATKFQRLLNEFQLGRLFVSELGWENPTLRPQPVPVNGHTFTLTQLAHKRGVSVFQCTPDATGAVPPRATLLKLEKEASKLAYEHLLIFTDVKQATMTWLWVARVPGQPAATRTHTWHKGTSGESLRQKLEQVVWSLEEEEAITLTDVIVGLRRAFDRDSVSRAFYDRFKNEHEAFAGFIAGISAATDQAWYASLMLNRLMFVYFIQRKGFLDGNPNYLANRLAQVRQRAGKGKFHSFYRQFLRRLFHEGLGTPSKERDAAVAALVGDVPYLNGGLFALHQLEETYPAVDVPDEAFERLFGFFDSYDWHLDDRPLSSGNEINPDVLGYIFEKYINQKQMGAYYTKEDVTENIAKNTVVPHLLDQAQARCRVAFDGEASVWSLLKNEPDRYLYPSLKTGVVDRVGKLVPATELPDFVQSALLNPKATVTDRRYGFGEAVFKTATGERGTLPTETWREYSARRLRCIAIRNQLARGEIQSANELITLNLDIRQFMQDVIDTCAGVDLLRAIWQAIVGRVPEKAGERFRYGITVLDPTCGSGAFLFAALVVLEPLYEACLERMESFVEDAKKLGKPANEDFVKVLGEAARHPSRRYFIYKNIILHNLFGVDIMAEAVEICKLRLFLKLVSQVHIGRELEPLPDIDFNIRCGNTLIGYATEAKFDASNTLASDQVHRAEIKASTADLADLFDRFREQQTVQGGRVTAEDKRYLRAKLDSLSLELDRYLARDYGIDAAKSQKFGAWRQSHQPLHWFAEFYGVMQNGGFDVVIGNPPYVATSKITGYSVKGLETISCPDIYAWCLERVADISDIKARTGMIVPLSLSFTSDFSDLRSLLYRKYKTNWFSHFARIPAALFAAEVRVRNTIHIGARAGHVSSQYTTRLHRWFEAARPNLFSTLSYSKYEPAPWSGRVPKLNSNALILSYEKLFKTGGAVGLSLVRQPTKHKLYFKKTAYNWLAFSLDPPPCYDLKWKLLPDSNSAAVYFDSETQRDVAFLLLNGKLEFSFWVALGDDLNFPKWAFAELPTPLRHISAADEHLLRGYTKELQTAVSEAIVYKLNAGKHVGSFNLAKCRHITDKSDAIFARIYGFDTVWDDVELLYTQIVKTNFGTEDE